MPYTDRPKHMRQRPLGDGPDALRFPVSDECSAVVWAKAGSVLFIEGMWHGDYQQVPVDPDELDNLIDALHEARGYLIHEREGQKP